MTSADSNADAPRNRQELYDGPVVLRRELAERSIGAVGRGALTSGLACGFLTIGKATPWIIIDPDVGSHTHVIVYVLRGTGHYHGPDNRTYDLRPGSLFQRVLHTRHSTQYDLDSGWAECFFRFSGAIPQALIDLNVLDPGWFVVDIGLDPTLMRRIRALIAPLRDAEESDLPRFYAMFVDLAIACNALAGRHGLHDRQTALIDRACRALIDDLAGTVKLEEVAAALNMGYENFRKWFRKQVGSSPGEYRIRRRIDRARELLLTDSRSIKELAATLGYENPSTFSIQFKHWVGTSPDEFRRYRRTPPVQE